MYRQRGVNPHIGEVVNVVVFEGSALAACEGAELPVVSFQGLFLQGAAQNLESAGGVPVVMPSVVGACGPGAQPDLEVRAAVELDPL